MKVWLMNTAETRANPFGDLVCAQQPRRFDDRALAVIHFDSIGLSHGLLIGR